MKIRNVAGGMNDMTGTIQRCLIGMVMILVVLAVPAQAATIVWKNQAGQTNWLEGASWVGGVVPGANDVASFPAPPVLAQPYLPSATNVNGLLINNQSSASAWNIEGPGLLTIMGSPAAYGINFTGGGGTRIYSDIILGGPQMWTYTTAHANAILCLYGNLSGTGPLTKPLGSSWGFNFIYYQNTNAPTFTGGLNHYCSDVRWQLYTQSVARTVSFGLNAGATGPGTITLGGGAKFTFETTSDGVNTPTLTLNNPFVVSPNVGAYAGGGIIQSYPGGPSSKYTTNIFSGNITLNGPLGLIADGSGTATRYTGQVIIDRTQTSVGSINSAWNSVDYNNALDKYLEGNIVDSGAGAFSKPLVLRSRNAGQCYITGTANTYAGGTVVEYCGDSVLGNAQNGCLQVGASSKLGTGDVLIMPGGKLRLTADANIQSGKALRVQSNRASAGIVSSSFLAAPTALTADSDGIFAIDITTWTAPLDMSTVGNGRMTLGSGWGTTYSAASLLPGSDKVYRLGGGWSFGAYWPTLDISAASLGDVGGACSLHVGMNAHNGNGSVTLRQNNPFSGDILVTGYKMGYSFAGGAQLVGYAQGTAGQSPFGKSTSNVRLDNGELYLLGRNSGKPVTNANLTFSGLSIMTVDSTSGNYPTQIAFDSLTRTNNGVLLFYPAQNRGGGNEKFLVTNPGPAPFVTNGICPPYLLAHLASGHPDTGNFLAYDANGFSPFANYETSLPSPGAQTNVVKYGGAVSGDSDIWALKTTAALTGTGVIKLRSGGLVFSGDIGSTVSLDFGTAEGIIHGYGVINGQISGSGGLTVAGYAPTLANVNNDFTGQVTVSGPGARPFPWESAVYATFDTAPATHGALGNANNGIYLNGGALSCRYGGNCLLATRTLTLGPLGGDLENQDGSAYTIYGPIVGSGFLWIKGDTTFDSPNNTYSGGTIVRYNSGNNLSWINSLKVNANSSVGSGDVMVSYGSVNFLGDHNMSTNARLYLCANVKTDMYQKRAYFRSANPTIGSLVGAGDVQLGNRTTATNDTALTVGLDNTSCSFYGYISENTNLVGKGKGSLTKAGTGAWTLYGAHDFTGPTTVSNGTLVLMGSVASNLVVNSGATLSGSGAVGGALTLESGSTFGTTLNNLTSADVMTVAGNVTLGGTLIVSGASLVDPLGVPIITTTGGTISGTFANLPLNFAVQQSGNSLLLIPPPLVGTVIMIQ